MPLAIGNCIGHGSGGGNVLGGQSNSQSSQSKSSADTSASQPQSKGPGDASTTSNDRTKPGPLTTGPSSLAETGPATKFLLNLVALAGYGRDLLTSSVRGISPTGSCVAAASVWRFSPRGTPEERASKFASLESRHLVSPDSPSSAGTAVRGTGESQAAVVQKLLRGRASGDWICSECTPELHARGSEAVPGMRWEWSHRQTIEVRRHDVLLVSVRGSATRGGGAGVLAWCAIVPSMEANGSVSAGSASRTASGTTLPPAVAVAVPHPTVGASAGAPPLPSPGPVGEARPQLQIMLEMEAAVPDAARTSSLLGQAGAAPSALAPAPFAGGPGSTTASQDAGGSTAAADAAAGSAGTAGSAVVAHASGAITDAANSTSWVPSSDPAARASSSGSVAMVVAPHHHTLFCERRRRVCSAVGRLREGNSLQLVPLQRSSGEAGAGAGSGAGPSDGVLSPPEAIQRVYSAVEEREDAASKLLASDDAAATDPGVAVQDVAQPLVPSGWVIQVPGSKRTLLEVGWYVEDKKEQEEEEEEQVDDKREVKLGQDGLHSKGGGGTAGEGLPSDAEVGAAEGADEEGGASPGAGTEGAAVPSSYRDQQATSAPAVKSSDTSGTAAAAVKASVSGSRLPPRPPPTAPPSRDLKRKKSKGKGLRKAKSLARMHSNAKGKEKEMPAEVLPDRLLCSINHADEAKTQAFDPSSGSGTDPLPDKEGEAVFRRVCRPPVDPSGLMDALGVPHRVCPAVPSDAVGHAAQRLLALARAREGASVETYMHVFHPQPGSGAPGAGTNLHPFQTPAGATALDVAQGLAAARSPLRLPLVGSYCGRRVMAVCLVRSSAPGACRALERACRARGPVSLAALEEAVRSCEGSAIEVVPPSGAAVEPGIPRARSVWIEGRPVEGEQLRARVWYHGGRPSSSSRFEWVRVSADGERTTEASREGTPGWKDTGSSASDRLDGATRSLAAADVGSVFKVTCIPIRQDSDDGAPATSKPSKPVAGASEVQP